MRMRNAKRPGSGCLVSHTPLSSLSDAPHHSPLTLTTHHSSHRGRGVKIHILKSELYTYTATATATATAGRTLHIRAHARCTLRRHDARGGHATQDAISAKLSPRLCCASRPAQAVRVNRQPTTPIQIAPNPPTQHADAQNTRGGRARRPRPRAPSPPNRRPSRRSPSPQTPRRRQRISVAPSFGASTSP